jgi:hypothetical protein
MTQSNAVFTTGRCLDMPSFTLAVEATRPQVAGIPAPGAAFITNPDCTPEQFTAPIAVLGDGYRVGPARAPFGVGYYTYEAYFTDQAGNVAIETTSGAASPIRNHMVIDPVGPLVTGLGIPASITAAAGGQFSVTGTDDVEVIGYSMDFFYPNVGMLRYPRREPNARFDDLITTPVQFTNNPQTYFPSGPFVRGVEIVDGANAVQAPSGAEKPTAVRGALFDVFGAFSFSANVPIFGGNVENGVSFQAFNAANPTLSISTWRVLPLAAAGFAPQGLKAQVMAPLNAINAPFVRVDFYREAGGEWFYLGSSQAPINSDNGVNRFWTYVAPTPFVNGPGSMVAQDAAAAGQPIIAIGVTAAGDGLSTLNTNLVP